MVKPQAVDTTGEAPGSGAEIAANSGDMTPGGLEGDGDWPPWPRVCVGGGLGSRTGEGLEEAVGIGMGLKGMVRRSVGICTLERTSRGGSEFLRLRGSVEQMRSIWEKAAVIGSSKGPAISSASLVHTSMGTLALFSSLLCLLNCCTTTFTVWFFKASTVLSTS